MRLFRSGLRKLVRRPASLVTFLLLIGLLLLTFLSLGLTVNQFPDEDGGASIRFLLTFPGAYANVLSFILGLGGLLAIIYAAAIAGSEWSWGTLKSAVARGEGRSWYVLMTYLAVLAMIAIGLLAAFAVGVLGAVLGATMAGIPTDGLTDADALALIPEQLARGFLALAENAAIGFAVAAIARSQLAGIGVGIALYFGEQFALLLSEQLPAVRWLPFNAASAVVATEQPGTEVAQLLDPNTAIFVVAGWLVAALALAALMTERAEIGD